MVNAGLNFFVVSKLNFKICAIIPINDRVDQESLCFAWQE